MFMPNDISMEKFQSCMKNAIGYFQSSTALKAKIEMHDPEEQKILPDMGKYCVRCPLNARLRSNRCPQSGATYGRNTLKPVVTRLA